VDSPELLSDVSEAAEEEDCAAAAGFAEDAVAAEAESVEAVDEELEAVAAVVEEAVESAVASVADAAFASVEDVEDSIRVVSVSVWFCSWVRASALISAVSPSCDVETVAEELADAESRSSCVVELLLPEVVAASVSLDSSLDVTPDKILDKLFAFVLMDETILKPSFCLIHSVSYKTNIETKVETLTELYVKFTAIQR
jgi:hypothetical protein